MIDVKNLSQDQENSQDVKPNIISHDSQTEPPNNATEGTIPDSGSVSASSNDNRKVSRKDIELVSIIFLLYQCFNVNFEAAY